MGVFGARRPLGDRALREHHVLAAAGVRDGVRFRVLLRIEDGLHEAVVVTQVDEDEATVVSPPVHPAGERDRLALVRGTQFAAGVGLEHSDDSVANATFA